MTDQTRINAFLDIKKIASNPCKEIPLPDYRTQIRVQQGAITELKKMVTMQKDYIVSLEDRIHELDLRILNLVSNGREKE